MKHLQLSVLYVSIILAVSVAAWADGCLTAYSSNRIHGGYYGGILTAPPNCYEDAQCSSQYYVDSAIDCRDDVCSPGRCDEPATGGWCTGGQAPWTKNVWKVEPFTFNCWYVGIGGGCWNIPLHPVTDWACVEDGATTSYCYTAWYNDPRGRCE